MKPKPPFLLTASLLALAMLISSARAQLIRIEGSSAGLTLSQAAADEFRRSHITVKVDIGLSGSGGALSRLCRDEVDLVHSARPILKTEIEACRKAEVQFIELPLAFDAITVVVNRKNSFVESLTLAELRTMWDVAARGKGVRWSQVNARFPDAPLKLFAPDWQFESSGYFASALFGPGRSAWSDVMSSVDDNLLIQ